MTRRLARMLWRIVSFMAAMILSGALAQIPNAPQGEIHCGPICDNGGTGPTPPVTCQGTGFDFTKSCNSQYISVF